VTVSTTRRERLVKNENKGLVIIDFNQKRGRACLRLLRPLIIELYLPVGEYRRCRISTESLNLASLTLAIL
jgi:hypothetical protein